MAYVEGTAGNDNLVGGAGDDRLVAGHGNDLLSGREGNDWLSGGQGYDLFVFEPGHGRDTIEGIVNAGDGGDFSVFGQSAPTWSELIAASTNTDAGVRIDLSDFGGGTIDITARIHAPGTADHGGTLRVHHLSYGVFVGLSQGTDGDDYLPGGAGDDTLIGGAGDDWLSGGWGADCYVFAPGHGADRIYAFGESEGDHIDLGLFGQSAPTWAELLASATGLDGGVRLDLSAFGGGTIDVFGITRAQLNASHFEGLNADPKPPATPAPVPNENPAATERGTSEADTLNGGTGDDNVYGEGGNDALLGRGGGDYVDGGAGNDKLWGQDGDDGLVGGSGNDIAWGGAGDDTVVGGEGRDILLAGEGADLVSGDAGDDKLFGGRGNDTVSGGAGADFVAGGAGDDSLTGGDAKDYLAGESGNDTLDGGAERDVLAGGAGDDRLIGGTEGDTFFGQAGADTFVFAGGRNWVMDFEPGTDRLSAPGFETSTEVRAAAVQVGAHVQIELDGGGDVFLAWTTLGELAGQELV